MDDVLLRIFVGAHLFPGTDLRMFNVSPGFGMDVYATPRMVLRVEGAVLPDRAFGGINLRTVIGR